MSSNFAFAAAAIKQTNSFIFLQSSIGLSLERDFLHLIISVEDAVISVYTLDKIERKIRRRRRHALQLF